MLARKDPLPLTLNNVKYHRSEMMLPDPPYLNDTSQYPINISIGRQLWVDHFLIKQGGQGGPANIKFVHHQAVDVTPKPLLEPNSGDERRSNSPLPDAVIYDPIAKEFKMWYVLNYEQVPHKLCLATSQDGVNWVRPSLDIEFKTFDPCCDSCAKYNAKVIKNIGDKNFGDNKSNVICSFGGCRNMKGRGSGSIIMDLHESDPSRRFKLAWGGFRNIKIYYSPDGINWSPSGVDSGPVGGSVWYLSWNPFRQKYIFTMRDNLAYASRGRLSRYMEVDNFTTTWPGWEGGSGNGHERYTLGQPVQYCISDQYDYHYSSRKPGVYCSHMVAYESIMINLFSIYHSGDGFTKRMSVYAGYSRDGFHYTRDNQRRDRPLIPEMGNKTYICPVGGNICISGDGGGDRVLIYYFYKDNGGMYTGCATIRRDGWVHIESEDPMLESVIETNLLTYKHDGGSSGGTGGGSGVKMMYLFVNVVINDMVGVGGGYLKIKLCDRNGEEIKSCVHQGVIDSCSLQMMQVESQHILNKEFTLQFTFKNCQLYSFWLSPSINGESNGFVGSGGPMFSSYQDVVGGRIEKSSGGSADEYTFPVDETVTVKKMKVMTQFKTSPVINAASTDVAKLAKVDKVDDKVDKVDKADRVDKVVKSIDLPYLPDLQIKPIFGGVEQIIVGFDRNLKYKTYQSISYDYYDLMVCNRDKQLVKLAKVQKINIPDIIGFACDSEPIYENYNQNTVGSDKFGRIARVRLMNKNGDSVIFTLFENSRANVIVANLSLLV